MHYYLFVFFLLGSCGGEKFSTSSCFFPFFFRCVNAEKTYYYVPLDGNISLCKNNTFFLLTLSCQNIRVGGQEIDATLAKANFFRFPPILLYDSSPLFSGLILSSPSNLRKGTRTTTDLFTCLSNGKYHFTPHESKQLFDGELNIALMKKLKKRNPKTFHF